MAQSLKDLKGFMDKFKTLVDNLKPSENLSQSEDEIEKIEEMINNIDEKITEIEGDVEEDEDFSNQRPLMDKFSELKNDFNIIKNNFYKKKDEVMTAHNKERLMRGELHGVEKKKAERDMALDQMKDIDEHGLLIDSIGDNLKGAGNNLTNMNVEAKKQREQINRVGDKVVKMDNNIKKTGQVMGGIERRVFCRKFIVWLGIIILFLANIIMVFLILARGFGWYPFNEPSYNGIDIDKGTINFEDLQKNTNFTFIMVKAGEGKGEGEESNRNLITIIDGAKDKKIKAGVYWIIKSDNDTLAQSEAEKAKGIVETLKDKDLYFRFYFKVLNDTFISNYNITSKFCEDFPIDCGLSLSWDNYNNNYKADISKINNIKNYWINSVVSDSTVKNEEKIKIWNIGGEYNNYDQLRYK